MELKTVIPNPCETCQHFDSQFRYQLEIECIKKNIYDKVELQRDDDQKILNPVIEALKKIASCEVYYEGDTVFIARDILKKIGEV